MILSRKIEIFGDWNKLNCADVNILAINAKKSSVTNRLLNPYAYFLRYLMINSAVLKEAPGSPIIIESTS